MTTIDPLAIFLSDPECHMSDILYINFRIYKKKLMWSMMQKALKGLKLDPAETLSMADIGASQGFDALYLLRKATQNFRDALPCGRVSLSLIEGDADLISKGEISLKACLPLDEIDFCYHHVPLDPLIANSIAPAHRLSQSSQAT